MHTLQKFLAECPRAFRRGRSWVAHHMGPLLLLACFMLGVAEPFGCLLHCWSVSSQSSRAAAHNGHNHSGEEIDARASEKAPESVWISSQTACRMQHHGDSPFPTLDTAESAHGHLAALLAGLFLVFVVVMQQAALMPLLRPPSVLGLRFFRPPLSA